MTVWRLVIGVHGVCIHARYIGTGGLIICNLSTFVRRENYSRSIISIYGISQIVSVLRIILFRELFVRERDTPAVKMTIEQSDDLAV